MGCECFRTFVKSSFCCSYLSSCWTHVGLMLDSLDARWLFFGTRPEHFEKSWTRVGLVLDSCWTRVGLCLAYYLHSFCCSYLSSCWTYVGLMLDLLDARWLFLVPELSILTKVGLALDSCWTHVGLASDCVWPIICTDFAIVN